MARTPDGLEAPQTRAPRLDLTERLDRLPHGHPSSPYEADGTPKPPVTLPRETAAPRDAASPREAATPTERAADETAALETAAPRETAAVPNETPAARDTPTRSETATAREPDAAARETRPPAESTAADREAAQADSQAPAEARSEAHELPDSHERPEPFTDTQWADHIRYVADRLEKARADGQATDERYTVEPNHEVWSQERRVVHNAIIDDLYEKAADVPNEHRAIIAGGLPGAGKTTVLEHHVGIDRSQFLTINPDDVKVELARRGLIPHVNGISPMEASDLAHEESSHVAKRLARRAQADGKNLIWDITMSSRESTEGRLRELRTNGYTAIRGVFVDLPTEVSTVRADRRHRQDEEKYKVDIGEGGRFIPADVIKANDDPVWGSTNRRTFEAVKPMLDSWSLYDNSVDGRAPVLIDSSQTKEERRKS